MLLLPETTSRKLAPENRLADACSARAPGETGTARDGRGGETGKKKQRKKKGGRQRREGQEEGEYEKRLDEKERKKGEGVERSGEKGRSTRWSDEAGWMRIERQYRGNQ